MIYLKTGLELLPGHMLYILHIVALFCIAFQIYKIRKQFNQKTAESYILEQAKKDIELIK